MTKLNEIFFHTINMDGRIDKQGMVLRRSRRWVTVEFYSWITGRPNGRKRVIDTDTETWRFYSSEAEWRSAGDAIFEIIPEAPLCESQS